MVSIAIVIFEVQASEKFVIETHFITQHAFPLNCNKC